MEQAKKQRFVGALVLGALILILVPAILDFSQDDEVEVTRQDIPPAPDVRRMEVLPLDVWSSKKDPQINPANRIIDTPTPVAEPVIKASPADKKPAAKPIADVAAEPAPKPVAKPAPVKKPSDTPRVPVVPEGAAAWVVQIASFSSESKAFVLRDRLREAKHPAFIERGSSKSKLIYRVKVGPVLLHEEAKLRKKQVKELTKLDGFITKYR